MIIRRSKQTKKNKKLVVKVSIDLPKNQVYPISTTLYISPEKIGFLPRKKLCFSTPKFIAKINMFTVSNCDPALCKIQLLHS